MVGEFTHISLTLIFVGLPLVFVVFKYKEIVSKNLRIIFSVLLITLVYSFIVDNIAVLINIWDFSEGAYSGIRIPIMPVDDLIFISFVQMLISSVTLITIEKKKKWGLSSSLV